MVESKHALQATDCDDSSPGAVTLTSLPDELLLEIVDCLPRVSVLINRNMPYDEDDLTRREIISALSQTCRRFRILLHPLLWQTIEAVAKKGVQWKKRLATDLVRQLDFAIHNPSIAEHVESLSIIVTDDLYASVTDKLCAGLAMFKNLHTLQIPKVTGPNFIFTDAEWLPWAIQMQQPLLSVRTMAMPWQLFALLHCTPNLERLHIVDWTPRPWGPRTYHRLASKVLRQVPYLKELTSTDLLLDASWICDWYAIEAPSLEHLTVQVYDSSSEPTPSQHYLEQSILDIVWELHWLRTLKIVAGRPNDDDTFWKESQLNLIEPLRRMIPKRNVEPLEPSSEAEHPMAMVRGPPSTSLSLTFVYPSGAEETIGIEGY
ncbi:uncharacterized protein SCHCODRAFT_02538033 [Schizophyllum commune H4-8]|uniref:uncharacterized protein n=1 Tax=Schizophyllum commune (strain H4-8 / FGSC 9210) TaxID=578458 RepID=UPI00215ED7D0|nr:uncharacterized protein SCHCODRAFT_02538033 [Schizophyllum commune H4-8]KAI5893257.1 hypothetical protein SCHCODRAFT_02538033 [Schizophyllum commune H4-8]